MGYSSWSSDQWNSYAATTSTKSTAEIFSSIKLNPELNPYGVHVRESRDSAANPNSTAVIVGVDVTGSMGIIADYLVRTGIGVFFEELLNRKPVTDPHMMIMGIGDAKYDSAPLQVSQFEADLTIAKWLEKIYVEHGGGGNSIESYELPYYFAFNHTSIDCFEKRGKKGYIFTIGDEECPEKMYANEVKKIIGDDLTQDMTFEDILQKAQQMYNCYHIMIAQGSHARSYGERVKSSWRNLFGQKAIWLEDYNKLSETMVSLIQINEGENKDKVIKTWSGDTAMIVTRALVDSGYDMTSSVSGISSRGVTRF